MKKAGREARKIPCARRQWNPTLFAKCAKRMGHPAPFWQTRFHDFNVWTEKKRVEKLRYMHRNPVKRGLTATPEDWRWSSYRWATRRFLPRRRTNPLLAKNNLTFRKCSLKLRDDYFTDVLA